MNYETLVNNVEIDKHNNDSFSNLNAEMLSPIALMELEKLGYNLKNIKLPRHPNSEVV